MGAFRSLGGAIAAGLVIGVAAALASAVIVIALMGGLTASGTGILDDRDSRDLRRERGQRGEDRRDRDAMLSTSRSRACSSYLVLERLPLRLSARFRSARFGSVSA